MATTAELETELTAARATRLAIIESRVQTIAYPEHSSTQLSLPQLTTIIRDLEYQIAKLAGTAGFIRIQPRRAR